jgi:hypothetical protein
MFSSMNLRLTALLAEQSAHSSMRARDRLIPPSAQSGVSGEEDDESEEHPPGRVSGFEFADRLGIPEHTQFHLLSFEGPDAYSRIGGLETRVSGLCQALVRAGHETHLWFIGQPDLPGYELRDGLHLHRFCQWISRYHPRGVYDGQYNKVPDFAGSLPPALVRDWLAPHVSQGGHAAIMAEEWQTADAVLHLDHLLRQTPWRNRVRMFWNANNVFGFERIDWERMRRAAHVTTAWSSCARHSRAASRSRRWRAGTQTRTGSVRCDWSRS